MKNIKLKVCGMRDPNNILEVLDLQPDFMGFIFYRNSPRFVGDDFVVPEPTRGATKRVGVFVDERTDVILEKVRSHGLDYVQLHGNETPDECRELKANGVGVIKVFSVDDSFDFSSTKQYSGVVEYFLFDTKGKYHGGNATRFSWDILSRYDQSVPFFLSGGITPQNVAEVKGLNEYNLFAIDVNSGMENRPAHKDTQKINAVIKLLNTK